MPKVQRCPIEIDPVAIDRITRLMREQLVSGDVAARKAHGSSRRGRDHRIGTQNPNYRQSHERGGGVATLDARAGCSVMTETIIPFARRHDDASWTPNEEQEYLFEVHCRLVEALANAERGSEENPVLLSVEDIMQLCRLIEDRLGVAWVTDDLGADE